MGNEGRVHELWETLRNIHPEALLPVSNAGILYNGGLKVEEGDDGGSVMEVANGDSGALDGLVLVDYVLDFT